MHPAAQGDEFTARVAGATEDAFFAIDQVSHSLLLSAGRTATAPGGYVPPIERATALVGDCVAYVEGGAHHVEHQAAVLMTQGLDVAEREILVLERDIERKLGRGTVFYRLRDLVAAVGNLRRVVRARAYNAH